MSLIPINIIIGPQTAKGLEIRVIMDNLFNLASMKTYYAFFDDLDQKKAKQIGPGGNVTLSSSLSSTIQTAIINALSAELDVVPQVAALRIWQYGSDQYLFTYRITTDDEKDKPLTGAFISEEDASAIKAEVLSAINVEELPSLLEFTEDFEINDFI